MNSLPGFEGPALRIPFQLRGYGGEAIVYYGTNHDPMLYGFDLLGLPFDLSTVVGFPVFLATTEYAGAGYRAVMGWTQVVVVTPHDGGEPWTAIDLAPIGDDARAPAAFSYQPSLFDAPGPNPPRYDERWEAESYLLIVPDVARSRNVIPVLGVRWGYDLVHGQIRVLPLARLAEDDWRRRVPLYREACPAWRISDAFHRGG
ncbi:MAG: hypothetical protein M0Z66_12585 [Thermaerobacter sp.]|nr:hypothetical protein [Thermaerobacter sp.]